MAIPSTFLLMAPAESSVKQEQLRKRRNNLLRRHNDFWRLYSIRSWVVLEMPNGRIYTYSSQPDIPAPTMQEIVGHFQCTSNGAYYKTNLSQCARPQPAIHKSPADYLPHPSPDLAVPTPPALMVIGRRSSLWKYLTLQIQGRLKQGRVISGEEVWQQTTIFSRPSLALVCVCVCVCIHLSRPLDEATCRLPQLYVSSYP